MKKHLSSLWDNRAQYVRDEKRGLLAQLVALDTKQSRTVDLLIESTCQNVSESLKSKINEMAKEMALIKEQVSGLSVSIRPLAEKN